MFLGLLVLFLRTPAQVNLVVPGKMIPTLSDPQVLPETASLSSQESTEKTTSYSVLNLLCLPCVMELAIALFCLKFVRNCLYMWLPLYFLEYLSYTKVQVSLTISLDIFSYFHWSIPLGNSKIFHKTGNVHLPYDNCTVYIQFLPPSPQDLSNLNLICPQGVHQDLMIVIYPGIKKYLPGKVLKI